MELSQLAAYASTKYQIKEQHKWADFPGFSVLVHPRTGKWLALLMRQFDEQTGEMAERCDLKCGRDVLAKTDMTYLGPSFRMKGGRWVGISFDETTNEEVVFRLFDEAYKKEDAYGYTVVLSSLMKEEDKGYADSPLPFERSTYKAKEEVMPDRLWQMRKLYRYSALTSKQRAECFHKQAVFMKDYEDEYPWQGDFQSYFPVYQDLNTKQLRAYFSWRSHVRKGEYSYIPTSAAYIYIYELLNGVGVSSKEDVLKKIRSFEEGYLDSGIGDPKMRANLHKWMLEYAIIEGLPKEVARNAADEAMMKRDEAIASLRFADERSDEEVFDALSYLSRQKLEKSPAVKKDPLRGKRLFANAWRKACEYKVDETDLFILCFDESRPYSWYPLSSAVYDKREESGDLDYDLNGSRSYHRRSGIWYMEAYERPYADKDRLNRFVKRCDALFRSYLKTGHDLKKDEESAWADPFALAAIKEDQKEIAEAARRKVTIDLTGLKKIREDAEVTKESLLIDEEENQLAEFEPAERNEEVKEERDLPLDDLQESLLRALLKKEDVSKIITEKHLMASILADEINEALFDTFGDTVLLCEGNHLMIVEDYAEELKEYLGGFDNE